jgi:hypothetical protein
MSLSVQCEHSSSCYHAEIRRNPSQSGAPDLLTVSILIRAAYEQFRGQAANHRHGQVSISWHGNRSPSGTKGNPRAMPGYDNRLPICPRECELEFKSIRF